MTSQNDKDTSPKSGKWSRRKTFVAFGAAALLAAGAFASTAHSGGYFGHGFGHGPRHMGFMHNNYDPAKFEERLDKKLKHFAIEFDATEEQQQKLKTVITQLVTEMRPMRGKMRETRDQLQTLLTQPEIDRVAIEKLRAEKVAMVEDMSKKVTSALADAGDILNLEQRQKLAEFMEKFAPGHRGGWGHRWRRG